MQSSILVSELGATIAQAEQETRELLKKLQMDDNFDVFVHTVQTANGMFSTGLSEVYRTVAKGGRLTNA